MVAQKVYLFLLSLVWMEESSFCATVRLLSKDSPSCTDVPHSCDVLHQFLVVCLDTHCCLIRHRLRLIHLPLGLQERICTHLLILLKNLITQTVFLLLVRNPLTLCYFPLVGAQLVLIERNLHGLRWTLVRISGCWQMPLSISMRLIWMHAWVLPAWPRRAPR